MSAQETEIRIPGLTIAAKVWGPPEGRPVLSAHGWLDNAASFDRLAPLIEGARIVAFDFPGHGRSEHRPDGSAYHFIDWVSVFFDIADALGWQTFSLMCHSMGAAAASLAAGTFPERVERLALIDGIGPWSGPAEKAPEQLAKALEERSTLAAKSSRVFADPDDAVRTVAEVHSISAENARRLVDRGLEEHDGQWRFSYDLRLRGASRMYLTEDQVLAFLRRVACPTLLIRPEGGWPTDKAQMRRRIDAVDQLRLVRVDGGHHVHLEHPQRVAGELQAFLGGAAG